MSRPLLVTVLLAVLLPLLFVPAAGAAAAPPSAPLVAVVLAPYLSWDDVRSGYTQNLDDLVESGAVGDLDVTSLASGAGDQTPENGALMLSAGAWTRYDASAEGVVTAGGGLRYQGAAAQRDAQAGTDVGARPGALAEAIEAAGGTTVAIGNADLGLGAGPAAHRMSPAALMAAAPSGWIAHGDVAETLLSRRTSPAPFGVLSDISRMGASLASALAQPDVRRGPALVVVDPGDLARAHAAAAPGQPGIEPLEHTAALRAFDNTVALVRSLIPTDAVLIVAGQVASPRTGTAPGFAPIIVSGPGWSGRLTSGSTHRDGVVTAADVSASITRMLGAEAPRGGMGTAMTAVADGRTPTERVAELVALDATARSVDAVRPIAVDIYIGLAILVLGASVVTLISPASDATWMRVLQLALLGLLAFPVAGVLMFAVVRHPSTPWIAAALLIATTVVVWTLVVSSHYSNETTIGFSALAFLTPLVLVVDQWFGAPLSFSAVMSYSPIVGARFYGIGNEGAALVIGGFVTGATLWFDSHADKRWMVPIRTWAFPALGMLAVLTAAAPFAGANIGVAVWGTFTIVLVWVRLRGWRLGWRAVAVALLAAALIVAGLTAVDIVTPSAARTHVGRTFASAQGGSFARLADMLLRKVAMNVRFLTGSAWTLFFLAAMGSLAWLRLRPPGAFRDMLTESPDYAAALVALLLGGMLSYLTEDSGVVVPALLLLFPTVAAVYLMLIGRLRGAEE